MDLTFKLEKDAKFNVRSTMLIRYKDKILLCKRNDRDYYSLPGGRVVFQEDSLTAAKREIKEELNWDILPQNMKLIGMIENFYKYNDGTNFHEYLFVYETYVKESYFALGNFTNLENPNIEMLWISMDKLNKLNIKPNLIKDLIKENNLKQLIIKEN